MRDGLKSALLALLPSLRAYAFCLTSDRSKIDDLVYRAVIDIWTAHQGEKGRHLRIIAFSAVRRQFLRHGIDDRAWSLAGAPRLPERRDTFEMRFRRLPRTAREALSLTEIWHFTAVQAARICGCDAATIHRRVAGARRYLAAEAAGPLPVEFTEVKTMGYGTDAFRAAWPHRFPGTKPERNM